MYYYLLDRRVVDEKNFHYWDRLLPELQQSNIYSEAREVTGDTDIRYVLADLLRRKRYQTVIIVGNDATLACAAGAARQADLVFGYIPISECSIFAAAIELSSQVGEVGNKLAARRFANFDLLKINSSFALSDLQTGFFACSCYEQRKKNFWTRLKENAGFPKQLQNFRLSLQDKTYELSLQAINLSILNIARICKNKIYSDRIDASDGFFDVFTFPRLDRRLRKAFLKNPATMLQKSDNLVSHLRLKHCRISVDPALDIFLDGQKIDLPPTFDVDIIPHAFKLIV